MMSRIEEPSSICSPKIHGHGEREGIEFTLETGADIVGLNMQILTDVNEGERPGGIIREKPLPA